MSRSAATLSFSTSVKAGTFIPALPPEALDDAYRRITRVADAVRKNVTIDWTVRDNVRANLRVLVKRILRTHGYPPDKQERAAQLVLEQAEVLSAAWATS